MVASPVLRRSRLAREWSWAGGLVVWVRTADLADSYSAPRGSSGPLPGQVPGGAVGVAGVHGDVQPGVTHHGGGVTEAAHVAEFGPDRDRGDDANAELGGAQRPAAGLVSGQAIQLAARFVQLECAAV